MGINHILSSLIKKVYLKVFKVEMSKEAETFVNNLKWIFFGSLSSSILTFILYIYIIRLIGPTELGKFSIIQSISSIFIIFMILGTNTSIVKFLSEGRQKKKIITTSAILNIFLLSSTLLILTIFKAQITTIFKIDEVLYNYSILFGVVFSLYYFFEAITKGLQQIKKISIMRIINRIVVAVVMILLLVLSMKTFIIPLYAEIIGMIIFCILLLPILLFNLGSFDTKINKNLIVYGIFFSASNIGSTLIKNVDKIILNKFYDFTIVGVYTAYLLASTMVIQRIFEAFLTVFFPTASKIKNKRLIVDKLKKIDFIIFIGVFI